jgi:hypothetical protein
MDSLVLHPGAEQTLPPVVVGDAGGIFPGRLPFIESIGARGTRHLHP